MGLFEMADIRSLVRRGINKSFPALTHKNFRYFWLGQCVSLIGTWMQNAGQSWLVLKITENAFLLGLLNAAQFLPMLLFSLFAGVIVDRYPKRKVIIVTQVLLMLCAFALTILIWTDHVRYIYIVIIAIVLGTVQSIDMPARQAFMVELVGREDLLNAIALNSSIFNAARIVGPALAGIVMGYLGAGAAFFVNGVSFLAVIYGLYQIKIKDECYGQLADSGMMQNVLEGIKYIRKTPVLYSTVVYVAIIWVFCLNFGTLIPVFAKDILGQGEIGYGFLMAFMGAGATIGSLSLAAKSSLGPRPTVLLSGGVVLSVFLAATGMQTSYILSSLFLVLAGWGMVTFSSSANSILQINSPDIMRGRIMSVYALVTGGVVPFGGLYSGYIAKNFGADMAFLISGIIGIGFTALAGVYYLMARKKDTI